MPQSLAKVPGKETIGIDGHKDGKKRHVETITCMKCGISAFEDARHMGTERTTGENLAKIVQPLISQHKTIAVVADNKDWHGYPGLKVSNEGGCKHKKVVYMTRKKTVSPD